MSIERVVRPAAAPDNAPPKQAAARRSTVSYQPAEFTFGMGGSVKQLSGSYSMSLSLYAVKRPKENKGGGGSSGISFP